ncbi:hypothetical protein I4U23_027039 [Adineta vaga]|nr:hypothetical protein I4U23_027039 [Adineta vaga]
MFAWRRLLLLIISCIVSLIYARPLQNNRTFGPFNRSQFSQINDFDIQEIDIGNLPEILPNITRIIEHNLELIELPIGTVLHKSMQVPSTGLLNQTDVQNIYAAKNSWLSNLSGAQQYVNWGYGNIIHFEVIKKLKLFDITSHSNWQFIWSKMNEQLVTLHKQKLSLNTTIKAQKYLQQEINQLIFQQKILQLTIGYEIIWKEQIQLLLYYGDIITNDYSYHPVDEIKKRSCHPDDWFSINKRPTILKSKTTTFGGRKQDLNRVSFTTALDNIMADIITQFVNVDGYYSSEFPSLFHKNGLMTPEIAIHVPRDSLKIIEKKCRKQFYPCGSQCYRRNEYECYPGGILYSIY